MLILRTILLWLAFLLIVSQYFIDVNYSITLGVIFRLAPSGVLLLWFMLSFFFKEKLLLNPSLTPRFFILLINILRPLASLSIVLGALFKIFHWTYGNLLLLAGIGCMAIYSSILARYATSKSKQNPNIIDDLNED